MEKSSWDGLHKACSDRIADTKEELAALPGAPQCAKCKKACHKLYAKKMCQPCYVKTYNENKKNKASSETAVDSAPAKRGRPRRT